MLSILVTQFVVLWAVIDPVGSVPVYLSQTHHLAKKQRRLVAIKAVAIATGVLLFFLLAGQVLLEAMQIPLPAFQAAGGLVLLLFALTMIFGESKPEQDVERDKPIGACRSGRLSFGYSFNRLSWRYDGHRNAYR